MRRLYFEFIEGIFMYSLKKQLIGFLLFCLFLQISSDYAYSQTWKKISGSTDKYVNFLKFSIHDKSKLFVGSDAAPTDFMENSISFLYFGYGMQISSDAGSSFSAVKLSDYSIFDLIESATDESKLLVSARKQDIGRVLLSSDGGTTWDEETKRCEGSSQIAKFQSVSDGENETFYSALKNSSDGFRYSDDYFVNCSSSEGTNLDARDLAVSKVNPKVMFLAGNNAVNNRVLFSSDGGQSWEDRSSGLENYRILSIQTSPVNEAIVVVGADSITPTAKIIGKGVFYSDDYGKNWRHAGADGASVLDIQVHPSNPKYWAAAGGKKGVLISGTGGDYWEASTDGLPVDFFVRKVAIPDLPPNQNGIIVYASIYGEGIYKSENITTSVSDEQELNDENFVKLIYPVPASDNLGVSLNSNNDVSYEIFNLLGVKLLSGNLNNRTSIDISMLQNSTYLIKFSNSGKFQLLKFSKVN